MIPQITVCGGLPREPELRFTNSGAAVASFTIGMSDRKLDKDSQQWVTVRELWLPVTIWDESGEHGKQWAHMAAELQKGAQIAVTGKLLTRQWEGKDGTQRSRVEMLATAFYEQPTFHTQAPPSPPPSSGGWGQQGGFSQPAPDDGQPPF